MEIFVLFFMSFASHAAPPAWEQVAPAFRKFCVGCHVQYGEKANVLGNREVLYARMKWMAGPAAPVATDMPTATQRVDIMKPENAATRAAMLEFVKPGGSDSSDYPVDRLVLPQGFKISLYAKAPGARSLAQGPDGVLYVSTGGFSNALDRIYRIKDWNRNGKIEDDENEIFISGLGNPNGIAFRQGSLFVAEIDRILVWDNVNAVAKGVKLKLSDARTLPQRFPTDTHHGWKFIRFAPAPNDNWLYVPVGAPCNICRPPRPEFSAIHRIDVTGTARENVALGVRNTVGFDFHPVSGKLWFTDNGRDSMGDDRPPDELNEVSRAGEHFGYPYCHGKGIVDTNIRFDNVVRGCADTTAAKVELGPHVAALGMRFYRGSQFPAEYRGQIFIAEHGSWNRSRKSGYRVTTVTTVNGNLVYKPFITGWLDEATQKAWGRPVDIEELADGSLLVSDDGLAGTSTTGAIYKVQKIP